MTENRSYEEQLQARQKQFDAIVEGAMSRVTSQIAGRQPPLHSHFFYGASAIHPKHLVAWYVFRTDSELKAARRSGLTSQIEVATHAELAAGGFPQDGVELVAVSFDSDQNIRRTAGGNYRDYFQ